MENEKWQDPSENVFNIKYLGLSLSATLLIVLGVIGHFLPELLSVFGLVAKNGIHEYWYVFIGLGVVIGAINAITTFSAKKQVKQTQ